jgi:MFS family permease
MSTPVAALEAKTSPGPGAAYRRYALTLLMLVAAINVLDRQVVNILVEPIRAELHLSDAQLGLLTGGGFALFYALMSLPIARLAERRNRALIVAASMALWSLATIGCGLARTFPQLFAARILVGAGEAGSGPAGQALVTDMTPTEERASALALVGSGTALGGLVGLMFGGLAADAVGWRVAFILAGLPGLVLGAVTALTLRDPRPPVLAVQPEHTLRAAVAELLAKRSFWWCAAGSSLLSFTALAYGAFLSSLMLRSHGEALAAWTAAFNAATGAGLGVTGLLGSLMGVSLGLAAIVGVLAGGALADRAARTGLSGYMRVATLAALVSGPLYAAAAFAPPAAALGLLALATVVGNAAMAPVLASAQSVVRPQLRATAAAVLFVIVYLFALGLGPVGVGLLSDLFAARVGPATGLAWALASGAAACPLAAFAYARACVRMGAEVVG